MTRTEYKAAYSAARKFNRFQLTFWDRLCDVPDLTFHQYLLPDFSGVRRSCDWLNYPPVGAPCRLAHLRLPVRLPG